MPTAWAAWAIGDLSRKSTASQSYRRPNGCTLDKFITGPIRPDIIQLKCAWRFESERALADVRTGLLRLMATSRFSHCLSPYKRPSQHPIGRRIS
jgi:hypothetical protein